MTPRRNRARRASRLTPGELREFLQLMNARTLDIPREECRCEFCFRETSNRVWGVCRACFPFFEYLTLASARRGYQRAI